MRMLPAHSPEFFALLAQLAVEQHPDLGVLDEVDLVGLLVEARPEVDRLVDWPPTRGRSEGTSGSCAGGGEDAHEQPAADRVARRHVWRNLLRFCSFFAGERTRALCIIARMPWSS